MPTLPEQFNEILQMFAVHFSAQVWERAKVLLTGAVLVRGQRTVASVRCTAWYDKPLPTFSDAIAAVRYALWRNPTFHTSNSNSHIHFLPTVIFDRFAAALCFNT
jgi:hypothetical protein